MIIKLSNSQIVHHNPCFNVFIFHKNSFDNQWNEMNEHNSFLRFHILSLPTHTYIYYISISISIYIYIYTYIYPSNFDGTFIKIIIENTNVLKRVCRNIFLGTF